MLRKGNRRRMATANERLALDRALTHALFHDMDSVPQQRAILACLPPSASLRLLGVVSPSPDHRLQLSGSAGRGVSGHACRLLSWVPHARPAASRR